MMRTLANINRLAIDQPASLLWSARQGEAPMNKESTRLIVFTRAAETVLHKNNFLGAGLPYVVLGSLLMTTATSDSVSSLPEHVHLQSMIRVVYEQAVSEALSQRI